MAKAKFGYFNGGSQQAMNEFEGDYMLQRGEYVGIYLHNPSQTRSDENEQVVGLRITPGQFVKKLS